VNQLRVSIGSFDNWFTQQTHVRVFTDDSQCLARIQLNVVPHLLVLPDGVIPRGAGALMLHLWNEHVPLIPAQGPDLAWALDIYRRTKHSLRLIARHIQATPGLHEVRAIGGIHSHIFLKSAKGGKTLLEQLGFIILPYYRPMGAFGEFWENFYSWWLMWTYNPGSTRHRSMFNLQRTEFWISREAFLLKYL
jgi:hypothetical protein